VAVEALVKSYSIDPEADRGIEKTLRAFYRSYEGDGVPAGAVERAVREVQGIYHRSFFPDMKVDWRSYPDNIGHMIFDGCFRCHNGEHVSESGGTIRKDCNVCHEFLEPISGGGSRTAFRASVPDHPIELLGIHAQLKCSSCHTGGPAPQAACAGCHATERSFQKGEIQPLPGLEPAPWVMVELDCESCRDLTEPQTAASLGQTCEACHEAGYADWIEEWSTMAKEGRSKAAAAIAERQKAVPSDAGDAAADRRLVQQLQAAFDRVDRAGAQYNPELAEAVYGRIVELAH
jgi:hypothetical protein